MLKWYLQRAGMFRWDRGYNWYDVQYASYKTDIIYIQIIAIY